MIDGSATPGPANVLSVALVNDKPLIVAGLARMIRENSNDIRIADVELGGSDVAEVDIALFDLADGEQIEERLHRLRQGRDVTNVVIYTWHADDEVQRIATGDPTVTILPKSLSGLRLVEELRRVASASSIEHRGEPRNLFSEEAEPPRLPLDLSDRERDVVIGAASGLTNKALAQRTGLSENTIKTYLARAMQKTGSRNRAALAAWAAHHGLVHFD